MSSESVTGAFDLDDDGVVQQPIKQGGSHHRIAEHLGPFGEASVGGEDHGVFFIPRTDQLEEQIGAFFGQWQVADFIGDQNSGSGVARRLVNEAKIRQVVVFTHDVVFLLLLKQFATEMDVSRYDQHVRQLQHGAGVCAEELPWVALRVSKRIAYLRNLWQEADKLHRDGNQIRYETQASVIYGLLREAWERGVEEVLLGGVVERYRPSIQTLQIMSIARITEEDCKAVEIAMTKCSKWLVGHDQAPAARAEIPEPSVIKQDIEELENWRKAIINRPKKSAKVASV